MAAEHILQPGYTFGNEFEIGLTVILDALARSIPGNRELPSLTSRLSAPVITRRS